MRNNLGYEDCMFYVPTYLIKINNHKHILFCSKLYGLCSRELSSMMKATTYIPHTNLDPSDYFVVSIYT